MATSILNDEKDRLNKELANANRKIAQSEETIIKKNAQIEDLSKIFHNQRLNFFFL